MADSDQVKATEHNWVLGNWFCHLLFFLLSSYACFYGFINHCGRIGMMYYFGVSAGVLVFTTINLLFKGGFRQWISLTAIIVNTYVLPFSVYAYGQSMERAAGIGMAYVVVAIAISPVPVGLAVLVGGISFAVYQKYYYFELENATYKDMMWVSLAYISAAALAFAWKALIIRLYRFYVEIPKSSVKSQVDNAEMKNLKHELDEIKTEKQLLKEEIAMHILEMKQLSGQK